MSVPIISVAQMREWEAATWAQGMLEVNVIRRVGALLAKRIEELTREGELVVLLAGQGHNGDDVRAAATGIRDRRVETLTITRPAEVQSRLVWLLEQGPALVVDGLFGIGLNRPLDAPWVAVINLINEMRPRVLSVDVPSGLDADTGRILPSAVRAERTWTVGAPKRGLIASGAATHVGRLEVAADVGLADRVPESDLHFSMPDDFDALPPTRPTDAHKGSFGHLGVVAGSLGYHGAAVLAARGAMRAQPGLVTVFPQEEVYQPVAGQLAAAMVRPWRAGAVDPDAFDAWLAGPGLAGPEISDGLRGEVAQLWRESSRAMVVDATALDWIPEGLIRSEAPRVITPHPGEAARLLGISPAEVNADRVGAVRRLSEKYGRCWVVLKGYLTIIGNTHSKLYLNGSGNAFLAQGGTGDILAGYIAGLLAQGAFRQHLLLSLRHAVWQHGAAADYLTRVKSNWGPEDLHFFIGQRLPGVA